MSVLSWPPILRAVEENDVDSIRKLLRISDLSNSVEDENICRILVNACANIPRGLSPLHLAARNGNADIVKILIASGADVNSSMMFGVSPLSLAAKKAHLRCVRILLSASADVNQADDNNATALFLSSRKGHIEILKLLIDSGADVNKCTSDGCSPCFIAAERGHFSIVELLIKAGTDIMKLPIDCTSWWDVVQGNVICFEAIVRGHSAVCNAKTQECNVCISWKSRREKVLSHHREDIDFFDEIWHKYIEV